jgi:hypothetical protein
MIYLSTIGAAQANDPAHITSVYKCHVVKNLGFRSEGDHSRLAVFEPFINPHPNAAFQSSSPAMDRDTPCFVWFAASLAGSNSIRTF